MENTRIEVNCGLASNTWKTVTTIEGNCGGCFQVLNAVSQDGVWYGTVAPPPGVVWTLDEVIHITFAIITQFISCK